MLIKLCLQDSDGSDSSIVWNFRPGGHQIVGGGGVGGNPPPCLVIHSKHTYGCFNNKQCAVIAARFITALLLKTLLSRDVPSAYVSHIYVIRYNKRIIYILFTNQAIVTFMLVDILPNRAFAARPRSSKNETNGKHNIALVFCPVQKHILIWMFEGVNSLWTMCAPLCI